MTAVPHAHDACVDGLLDRVGLVLGQRAGRDGLVQGFLVRRCALRLMLRAELVDASLEIGALGVVYGDIGTSPLYALKTVFTIDGGIVKATPPDVYGVVSLMFWSITIIVSIKYVGILMRADNDGEGGVMALAALAQRLDRGGLFNWAKPIAPLILTAGSRGGQGIAEHLIGKAAFTRFDALVPGGLYALDSADPSDVAGLAASVSRELSPIYTARFADHRAADYTPLIGDRHRGDPTSTSTTEVSR